MSGVTGLATCGFWFCVAAIAYTYAGYPVLIWICSRLFGRAGKPPTVSENDLPRVSLLIVAHNEQDVIEFRLHNALLAQYPANKLEIVVASDGCTDHTPALVRRFAHRGVRLLHTPHRRGKAATLNWAIPQLTGDILVLSDANTQIDPTAVSSLVRWFSDPDVGAACGRLVLTDPMTGRNADGAYWKYETFLKRCEGRLGALLGANGAIYAIRRDLYVPIPDDTIIDDFVIPLVSKLEHGRSIVYDCDAVAREETAPDVPAEFRRRARIGAGGFQAIPHLWRLTNPRRGWIAVAFISHKLLRWSCPFFMIGSLLFSAALWPNPFYRWALLVQSAFYILSLPSQATLPRPLRVAQMFTQMNAALLVGFWRWWNGTQAPTWQPTARIIK